MLKTRRMLRFIRQRIPKLQHIPNTCLNTEGGQVDFSFDAGGDFTVAVTSGNSSIILSSCISPFLDYPFEDLPRRLSLKELRERDPVSFRELCVSSRGSMMVPGTGATSDRRDVT